MRRLQRVPTTNISVLITYVQKTPLNTNLYVSIGTIVLPFFLKYSSTSILCVCEKALAYLSICAGLSEPSLLDEAINTIISMALSLASRVKL